MTKVESDLGPSIHEPVLLNEIVKAFSSLVTNTQVTSREGEVTKFSQREASVENFVTEPDTRGTPYYLDGTLGGAGHALAFAKALNGKLKIIGLDRDKKAIDRARELLNGKATEVILENEDYRNLDKVLDKYKIKQVDMILLDLGISSDELENSGHGFSFQKDEPILMTMGDPEKYPFTAYDIVNSWKENDIANVIYGYGEERYAYRIAHKIILYREKKKIETTVELAEIIKSAVPSLRQGFAGRSKIHPATKTFQALRIAVNDELNALKDGLNKGYERLSKDGKIAVISFHSLEDRIVKEFFKSKSVSNQSILVTKKPILASAQEVAENPRSRSAKLRILIK